MGSKNAGKRKRLDQLKKSRHPVRVYSNALSFAVPCIQCKLNRMGTCNRVSIITERYGPFKLFKREIEFVSDFCSTGILDVEYARKYYDKHGVIPENMKI